MKRVVFSLSFFLLLLTLSNAFHPEPLYSAHVTNHQHHHHHDDHHQLQIKPSSDGSDSSNTLLPTDSYTVEFKEAVSEPEIISENSYPVQMKNPYSFPGYRFNPIRCREFHRFIRFNRLINMELRRELKTLSLTNPKLNMNQLNLNQLGFEMIMTYLLQNRDVVKNLPDMGRAIRVDCRRDMGPLHHPRHHYDHHDYDQDDEEDDHLVEMKEDDHKEEKKRGEEDDEEEKEENKKKYDVLKKIRNFMNYI